MGGTGARRDLAVGAGRAGEIIVAGGSHLARISAQSHAVLGTGTSEAGQTYQLSIRCNPTTQLCYWTRGARVEVWRDDLSARVASGDLAGIVDPGTGFARLLTYAGTAVRTDARTVTGHGTVFDPAVRPRDRVTATIDWTVHDGTA